MRIKPLICLLIAGAFFTMCMFDWYQIGDIVIWYASIFLTLVFSILAIFYGIRYIRNKERTGLLFVYDLSAIILGTVIFILTSGLAILLTLLKIDGLPRD